MNLLPYERVVLRSNEVAPVIEERLAHLVAAGWFHWRRPQEPFVGSVEGHRFKVVRVLGTLLGLPVHNSFRPIVLGEVAPVPGGAEVRIRFRLNLLVALFMSIWFSGLFVGAVMIMRHALWVGPHIRNAGRPPTAVGLAFIAVMALFGYALTSISFWTEVRRAKTLLVQGLGCTEDLVRESP